MVNHTSQLALSPGESLPAGLEYELSQSSIVQPGVRQGYTR
jgi:hypothetical protein